MKKGKVKKKVKQKKRKQKAKQKIKLKEKKEKKSFLRKIWCFLWESKSFVSWLVCLIICFLLVVFVFFPLASLILSTPLPFVVVESSSMEHKGDFSWWWSAFGRGYAQYDINQSNALEWSFRNGINKGDIIAVKGLKSLEEYKKGDVIIFALPGKTPIIHRIVSIDGAAATKGDNNDFQLTEERNIKEQQILGKAVMRIPKLGWIKLYPCSLCPSCCGFIDQIRKV